MRRTWSASIAQLVPPSERTARVQVGARVAVYWPMDRQSYEGEVVEFDTATSTHTIQYDDGEVERLNLADEQYKIVAAPAATKPKKQTPWARELCEYLTTLFSGSTATSEDVDQVVELICSSLADSTVQNYKGKVKRFLNFCTRRVLCPLPADQTTALLYMRDLHDDKKIQAENYQPYLSAVNSLHLDLGHPAPLVGHLVDRAKKGS